MAVLLVPGLIVIGFGSNKPTGITTVPETETSYIPNEPSSVEPQLEELAVSSTLDWTAGENPDELLRRVGPYRVRITKAREDEFVAPVVEITSGGQTIRMEGEKSSPTYSHQISVIQLMRGAAPVVMLQSYSGGAHCCNWIQLAGFSNGKLKVVDLGSWDGADIEMPTDLSNDGFVDFQFFDNSFLYAFSSYASSRPPPVILNVRGGKIVDVSKQAAFRSLFGKAMEEAGRVCKSGATGDERNGACAGYVAAAARIGKLEQAWQRMVVSYDATTSWDFPTGCRVATQGQCPPDEEIGFKSYPEALLHFLKDQGYVASGWQPPQYFQRAPDFEEDTPTSGAQTI